VRVPRALTREEFFNLPLEVDEATGQEAKAFTLVIYDISDDRRRLRLAKLLSAFGYRVQESAFEAVLPKRHLVRLMDKLDKYAEPGDNIRIYKLRGSGAVTFYGCGDLPPTDDTVFV